MNLKQFTFNGTSSSDFGLVVSNVAVYGSPARVVEKIQIPYRNGDLLIDSGAYNNYIVTYDVAIITNVQQNMRDIADWLLNTSGYCELSDDYNPDTFWMASYYNQLEYTMTALNRYGSATIAFDCKPQRYLKTGQSATAFTANGTISNPTNMASRPIIKVTGNGTSVVNGTSITTSGNSGVTIVIDCERMQCYTGSTNKSDKVTMDDYPTLAPGSNSITVGHSKVEITPRWWKL